jgi:alkanesulfonate monooxygenase SsuD/methylene tetrahydromethanopterin reductase-like flavin-dependent oxidoreductase (luciferase family)
MAEHALTYAMVGSPETVRRGIAEFVDRERPDEIMATAMIFDHAARLRSFELLAEIAAGSLSR